MRTRAKWVSAVGEQGTILASHSIMTRATSKQQRWNVLQLRTLSSEASRYLRACSIPISRLPQWHDMTKSLDHLQWARLTLPSHYVDMVLTPGIFIYLASAFDVFTIPRRIRPGIPPRHVFQTEPVLFKHTKLADVFKFVSSNAVTLHIGTLHRLAPPNLHSGFFMMSCLKRTCGYG